MSGGRMEQVKVTRYVTPLREGGSLPGIVEAEDLGTYVCKFRGAGQGTRVLVAEVVVAGLARLLEVPTPDQVVLDLDPEIARYEADEEVQDLINASAGLNLGIDFLPGSFGYDPTSAPDADLAGRVLWLDAFTANVDRSWRNPNLLVWRGTLQAIDHGASLYFHHSWSGGPGDPARFAAQPYDASEHILRGFAPQAAAQDAELAARLTDDALAQVLADVCDDWLDPVPGAETPEALRERYVAFLAARRDGGRAWLPAPEMAS
ncbi:HipA family kinase [Nocardioides daeguensis]|uniref:HipA-like kinase domain-containing protein n=1 Tax=Nocardioides daeguensis TaxID=908359 RepID=A0ABP6W0H5_9ACTN|nr:HipA family kinase [Nocardioides daeguensis]